MSAPKLLFMLVLCSSFSFMATSKCGVQRCGQSYPYHPEIRFPFRIIDREPKACGYPGFDVHCDQQNRTLLELHNSVVFQIYIDYYYQSISLSDPDDCLPKKLLSPNLLINSPFYAKFYKEFAVFNCSGLYETSTYNDTTGFDLHVIDCLSGTNYTVYAVTALWAVSLLSASCQWAANISVPADHHSINFPLENYTAITLYWEPNCGPCEKINRRCRITDDSGHGIECTSEINPTGSIREEISLSLGVGLPLFAVGVACLLGLRRCKRPRNEAATRRPSITTTRLHTTDDTNNTTTGIDQSILDLYPRVVIGESGRLIRPDDNSCPICLLEYEINQVLEILPHCQHRFHAACVDQWLVLKGTCPICRLPPPSR